MLTLSSLYTFSCGSQKKKRLHRLVEDYLLDLDASVQAVVGLDIEYGNKESRKATLTSWRTWVYCTSTEDELHAEKEVTDEVGYLCGSPLPLISWRSH
jgi:hypothetical protein